VNRNLDQIDPLIIFRCKNKICRQTFTPSTILNTNEQKLFFVCPICASKYEAKYTVVSGIPNQEVIMLLEMPRLVFLGTKIASS